MFSVSFMVEKTEFIDAPISDVFDTIADFSTWGRWSPWLCQERTCPVRVEGIAGTVDHSQNWDGEVIGSGKIQISDIVKNERINHNLVFFKPWKSKSTTGFRFSSVENGTEITWWMRGKIPFFMKKMMIILLGDDFSRGLSMLKELIETKEVLSETTVQKAVKRDSSYYIGKRRTCDMSSISTLMPEDLLEMDQLMKQDMLPPPKHVFSLYHSYDFVKGQCEYTCGYLYDTSEKAPEGLVYGQLPAHHALRVDHKGSYRHLGNAWSAAMGYVRAKHKINKSIPMYEIYPNDPRETAEKDILTEVYIPIRR